MKVTGLVKFCAVPLAGEILAPEWAMVGTSAVTLVPYGTVTAMVLFVSLTVPVADGLAKLKAVIALAGLAATVTVTV
ncbi:hypothetical protein D3C85_1678340 [compost metagenome]